MLYLKPLDSLRAFAVFLVVISHWIPSKYSIHIIPNGQIGVDMFFTLSGFLITAILFNARETAIEKGKSLINVVKNFYVRRALRIFPIYYLTIFILYIIGSSTGTEIRDSFIYFLTYTSNFYFYSINEWDGIVSHLWSLAVEEQYYLIWPWIVLFCRRKYILHIIIIFIIIGISSQIVMTGIGKSRILTLTSFDAFGLGSLLAWIITYQHNNFNFFFKVLQLFTIGVVAYFIFSIVTQSWILLSVRTSTAIITLYIISFIYKNKDKSGLLFKYILNNKILVFIGKISYGIYLYHLILPVLITSRFINPYLSPFMENIGVKYPLIIVLTINAIITILFSWLSYKLIEKPFLLIKERFNYLGKD